MLYIVFCSDFIAQVSNSTLKVSYNLMKKIWKVLV